MRNLLSLAVVPFVISAVMAIPGAQAPATAPPGGVPQTAAPAPPVVKVYAAQCATCHGPDMRGGSSGAILPYVRYHTNAEITAVMRTHKPPLTLPDAEHRELLTELRALAGTNPTMATGGYTGQRGIEGGGGRGRGGFAGRGGRGRGVSVSSDAPPLNLADGRTLAGRVMAESEFDATVLANGRYYLLSRTGDVYREKPIEPKADWLTYDGSPTGNRYSPLDQINAGNIEKLAPAWIFPTPTSTRLEVTPVVVDGVMYATGWNELYALDATTGRQLWRYSEPRHEGIHGEAGFGANRGAAIAGDKVFMVTDHAHLLGFNRFTGEKLWDAAMGSFEEGYSATAAPLTVGDLVLAGVAGGEEGARGFVDAYRAATGERVWRFYTVPARGEKGSETWIGQAIDHGCGATWLTGSYDPQLDLTYWGVGNPCPDYTGDERKGDNLYTASVVALSAKTGELKWHYQFTPHDTHDWDSTQPMLLVDEPWQGRPRPSTDRSGRLEPVERRKLLLHGDRNGMFYVLDRVTGELLLGTNLSSKVTWNKGFGKDGKPIVDPGSIATREGVAACPGSNGGANWTAASYSPLTKLFYTRVLDSCGVYASSDDPLGASGNRWFGRGTAGEKARADLQALVADSPSGSYIRALDPFTGKKAWDYTTPNSRAGLLATAGGLLFLGAEGGLVALDVKSGKPIWNINLGQSSSASPMTYMVGGRQYIALPGTGVLVAYALK